MSDEWTDDDCPRCRAAFTYLLRAHVRHQDGRDSQAPMLVFSDADYEDGDGSTGLHGDAKRANEPAIVYVRADQFLDAAAERDALRAALEAVVDTTDGQPGALVQECRQIARTALRAIAEREA